MDTHGFRGGQEDETGDDIPGLGGSGAGPQRSYNNFGVGEVLASHQGNLLLLDQSPLAPSRPTCAGDRGTLASAKVIDVIEEDGGLLHVLDRRLEIRPGAFVPIWRDPVRRWRIERAHAATVAGLAELARQKIPVESVETVAGLAWIETSEPVEGLDMAELAERDDPLEVEGIGRGRMNVFVAGQMVRTAHAPISSSTAAFKGAEARQVAALDYGHEALEIALPDDFGRAWWR